MNPYLPEWEYVPDGEPRVFGDRVYIYGSHDRPNSEEFCDTRLKVWSAPVSNPTEWICHGDAFRTTDNCDQKASIDYTTNSLFAPDVVEKDGKYYLFAYIVGAPGAIAVSDKPEGPFTYYGQFDTTAQVEYMKAHPEEFTKEHPERIESEKDEERGTEYEIALRDMEQRIFIDPGVLVDDDGRVYVYCGYLHSFMCEIDANDMHTVIPGSYKKDIIPVTEPYRFFEACSPRKIGDTYYLIYSPRQTTRLAYATSDKPTGPFTYRGYLVDSGDRYPGGNDHGSVAKVGDQWYVFYHKMTNGTCMSRYGCADRISLLEDGSFTVAETTSQGFEEALNPYQITPASSACVLEGGAYIGERDLFTHAILGICGGSTIGWRYFDFGQSYAPTHITLKIKQKGTCQKGIMHVHLDSSDSAPVADVEISPIDTILSAKLPPLTGKHALYLTFETGRTSWVKQSFDGRDLCNIEAIVFVR